MPLRCNFTSHALPTRLMKREVVVSCPQLFSMLLRVALDSGDSR